jgi:hypothetical protein
VNAAAAPTVELYKGNIEKEFLGMLGIDPPDR